ncbi:MAG: tonB [Fibrobacteres bacterium]|nr:tonB [Fibrobacterota bacterium]
MIAPSPRRRARHPLPGPGPDFLSLNLPPRRPPGWKDVLLGVGAIVAVAGIFFAGGKVSAPHFPGEEEVQVIEVAPPPPPPKEIKEPPKPIPPPPREKAPPIAQNEPPPPPQFGLDKDATQGNGDLSVATGNTLMQKADTVVKPVPPPPPPEPMRLDQEAEALEKIKPKYPEWAEEQGVTSRVLVMVTIDAEGKVIDVRIEKSGGKDFDQASLEAAKITRYKPHVEKGRPLAVRFVVPYEFIF